MEIRFANKLKVRGKDTLVFTPAYEDFLIREARTVPPRDRDGYISPSSVLGCPTRAVHQLNGEAKLVDPQAVAQSTDLLKIATIMHDYYQKRGQEIGILTNCEKFVEIPEWKVRGQIDGILKVRSKEDRRKFKQYLFEIKTCNNRYFDQVMETRRPLDHQVPQNMVYLKATGLQESRFWYIGRENPSEKKYEVSQKFDPEVMKRVEAWIENVLSHHEAGTYPTAKQARFDPKTRQCAQCPYLQSVCNTRLYNKSGLHLI